MRKNITLSLTASVLMCALSGCGGAAAQKKTESTKVWLDFYQETAISFDGLANPSAVEWKVEDNDIVDVENGVLIAKGVGETSVNGTYDATTYTIDVKVFDSGETPSLRIENTVFYVDVDVDAKPYVLYGGEAYHPDIAYTLTSGNTDVAVINDNKVRGVKEGNGKLTVSATYKGLDLSRTAKVTVKPNSVIEPNDGDDVELYACTNAKFSTKTMSYNVVVNGETIENPNLKYTIGDASLLKVEGNVLTALKEGETSVRVSLADKPSIYTDINVTIHPNYVEEAFNNNDCAVYGVKLDSYSGTIGGRKGDFVRFYNGDSMTSKGESYWSHRIVNNEADLSSIDAYKEKGYRYFVFDMYMTKTARMLFPLDGAGSTYYADYDQYFNLDMARILDEDGTYINKVIANQWITVVYDVRERIIYEPDSNLNFYLALECDGLTTYLDNVRYYMDDAFLPKSNLGYDEKDGVTNATNDEFVKMHSNSNAYAKAEKTVAGVENPHMLKTSSSDYEDTSLVVASSTGISKSACIERLQGLGNYLAFDLYVEKADKLYFSINNEREKFAAEVGKTIFEDCSWITLTKNGKREYRIEKGNWYTITIDYNSAEMVQKYLADPNSNSGVNIKFNLCEDDDVCYINNVRYFSDDDLIPSEYAKPMIDVGSKSLFVYRGEAFTISPSIINGQTSESVEYTISDSSIVQSKGGNSFLGASLGNCEITYTCGDLIPVTVEVHVIEKLSTLTELSSGFVTLYDSVPQMKGFVKSESDHQSDFIMFSFTVKKDFEALHLVETEGWGIQPANVTTIYSEGYGGCDFGSWESQHNLWPGYTGVDQTKLYITDESGNVLGIYGQEGIDFEAGKTYNVYYKYDPSLTIMVWASSYSLTSNGDAECYYWKSGSCYLNISEYIDFGKVFAAE